MMTIRSRTTCNDGTTLSIQFSPSHYCTPREDNPEGGYTEKEVGFVKDAEGNDMTSKMPVRWYEHAEPCNDDHSGVFAYTPVELIDDFIKAHGGVKEGGEIIQQI